MKQSRNPFIISQPVKNTDFIGREDILESVSRFLQDDTIKHLFIFGKRRAGKTSILKKIHETYLGTKQNPVYINLQNKVEYKLPELVSKISNLVSKIIQSNPENNNLIDKLISFKQDFLLKLPVLSVGNSLILLFDEFDSLYEQTDNELDEVVNYLKDLSRFIEINELQIKFIYAIGGNYKEKTQKIFDKFKNNAEFISIQELEEDAVTKILKQSEYLIPFQQDSINKIIELTGGNPYFTQCLAYKTFDYAENINAEFITAKMVNRQFIPSVKSFSSGAAPIWSGLNNEDKPIIFFAAHIIEQKTLFTIKDIINFAETIKISIEEKNVTSSLNRIINSNFIKEYSIDNFKFTNEFFRKWIVIEVRKREIRKIIKKQNDKK